MSIMTAPALKAALAFVFLFLGLQCVEAQGFVTWGAGTKSCGDWTAGHYDPNSLEAVAQNAWLGGFLTAADAYGAPESSAPQQSFNAVTAWMENYCSANPLDTITTAAIALRIELQRRATQSR
jgi:hypothetical protein